MQIRNTIAFSPAAQRLPFDATDSEVAVNTKLTVGNIDDADDSQWWKIVEAEDGTYRILNKKAELAGTPLYIATDSDSTTDGAPIVLADEALLPASGTW